MEWPCSKSVQSLGETAFVVQNKKSKQNNFQLCSDKELPQRSVQLPNSWSGLDQVSFQIHDQVSFWGMQAS